MRALNLQNIMNRLKTLTLLIALMLIGSTQLYAQEQTNENQTTKSKVECCQDDEDEIEPNEHDDCEWIEGEWQCAVMEFFTHVI